MSATIDLSPLKDLLQVIGANPLLVLSLVVIAAFGVVAYVVSRFTRK